MKITQEVREFARLNPRPFAGEGDSPAASGVRAVENQPRSGDPDAGMAGAETSNQDVDVSFAQMSKRFHEEGAEIYLPAE